MHEKYTALTALCLFVATGCAASDPANSQANSGAADEAAETSAQALGTIDAGEEQVTFYDDGNGGILIGSSKPNSYADFAITQLEKTAGTQLTPLEVFSALAPTQTPPDRLVADHTARVTELGRANGAMLRVAFDPERQIEKVWNSTQCMNTLGLNTIVGIHKDSAIAVDGCTSMENGYPKGSCNVFIKTARHRAGVCNNSSVGAINTTLYTRHDDSNWATATASVPRNGSYLWTVNPRLNYKLTGWQPSKLRMTAYAYDGSGFNAHWAPH